MSKPLSTWFCDVCGNIIETPESGYVTWKTSGSAGSHSFKIIHKIKCDLKDHIASAELTQFLGERGLTYLLSHLSAGPIIISATGSSHRTVSNIDEFVDFLRRLQIPYYEQARRKFLLHQVSEDYADSNEVYPYLPDTLKRIADKY